ncbi:MAG: DNA-binding response regulator, partial [Flavobacteriales bacterium]|nr:DNA-binding response regulator [Flavobacteriales bacterium]
MPLRSIIGIVLVTALSCGWLTVDATHNVVEQRHIQVALRKIGHQVLIHAEDSTSRVLPIHKKDDRYIVKFESEFALNPDDLVRSVQTVFEEYNIEESYIVEVEECESEAIAYSYEVQTQPADSVGFCADRTLPKGCYNLLFTLLDGSADELV